MVYVTGDLHGDIRRFGAKGMRRLKRGDTLIVCGDFGFLWTGGDRERRQLKRLGQKPYTILFLDGTHENHALLDAMPPTSYAGAPAHRLGKRLYHILRGGILLIEGRTFFVFGGGESEDRDMRTENMNWWSREMPSQQEIAVAEELLSVCGSEVDYILTHQPPDTIRGFLQMDTSQYNYFYVFLDRLGRQIKFSQWYFGSLHLDKKITTLHTAVFKEVLPLWKTKSGVKQARAGKQP